MFILTMQAYEHSIRKSYERTKMKKRALPRASFARPSHRTLLRSSIFPRTHVNVPAGRARSLPESIPLHAVLPLVNIPRQISIALTFTTGFKAEERERYDAHAIFTRKERPRRLRTPPRPRLAQESASASRAPRASARRLPPP